MSNYLALEARETIAHAEFRSAWPIDARRILVKAARTEGDSVPAFAEREVRWALKTAKSIERRMSKDVEVGESLLPRNRRVREIAARV